MINRIPLKSGPYFIAAFFLLAGFSHGGDWKKRVLAYGDSNTFGWFSDEEGAVGRHPLKVAWPGQLQKALGDEYEVIVEGLGGRTTNAYAPTEMWGSGEIPGAGMNGAAYLPAALSSHMPLDMVIILLGTNDLRAELMREPEDIARGLVQLTKIVGDAKWQSWTKFQTPEVIIISPTKLDVHTQYASLFSGSLAKSEALPAVLKPMVEQAGGHFFDAASIIPFPEDPDQIHLSPENHVTLGKALADEVRKILE